MAPVGHASRHPASAQCLQTSDISNHARSPLGLAPGASMKRTRRNVEAVKWAWVWQVPEWTGTYQDDARFTGPTVPLVRFMGAPGGSPSGDPAWLALCDVLKHSAEA